MSYTVLTSFFFSDSSKRGENFFTTPAARCAGTATNENSYASAAPLKIRTQRLPLYVFPGTCTQLSAPHTEHTRFFTAHPTLTSLRMPLSMDSINAFVPSFRGTYACAVSCAYGSFKDVTFPGISFTAASNTRAV